MSFIEEIKDEYEEYKSNKLSIADVVKGMLLKYGEDSQIDVAIEEMSELIKELVKYKRAKIHEREKQATSRAQVIEEMCDVLFMFEYLRVIFQINDEEIEEMILNKAMRVVKRYL